MKPILIFLLLTASINSYAESKVLAIVNGNKVTQAAVENFMLSLKTPISEQEALSKIIMIEILVSKRLETPIKQDSTLQLELDRNRKGLIANSMLEDMVAGFTLTKEELEAEYQQQYLSSGVLQEYNANHILVKTQEEAEKIIVSLNNNADFEELAKQLSTGPSGKNGGALGWFVTTKMVKPFADATASLTKGKITQTPIKTQFGWHIIKLNDVRTKTPPALKDVADKIKRRDAALKLQDKMLELQKQADITIISPR